jgi:GR25 family glycosyltransferase involved in LPS biosynthesis
MKTYVVHYSRNVQRKKDLESDPRFKILEDVTWIDWYDREEPECEWTKAMCKSDLNTSMISNTLKHMEAIRLFVNSDHEEMLLFEDDVVFQEGWYDKLQLALKQYPDIRFLRLDCVMHLKYDGTIKIVTDWWPSEAQYMKKDFAKFLLRQVSFTLPYDNYVYSLMRNTGLDMLLLPVCNQTSLVDCNSSIEPQPMGPGPPVYYDYGNLRMKLAMLKAKKWATEQKFWLKYGRSVNVTSLAYLEENDLD